MVDDDAQREGKEHKQKKGKIGSRHTQSPRDL
jgi:hypothetical protein